MENEMWRETQRKLSGGKTWECAVCHKRVWTIDPEKMPFDWSYAGEWSPLECGQDDVCCDECNSTLTMEE